VDNPISAPGKQNVHKIASIMLQNKNLTVVNGLVPYWRCPRNKNFTTEDTEFTEKEVKAHQNPVFLRALRGLIFFSDISSNEQ
jgi:hypothetical protein